VLGAINAKKILNVQFACIKYLPYYIRTRIIAGIITTKNGEWSQKNSTTDHNTVIITTLLFEMSAASGG